MSSLPGSVSRSLCFIVISRASRPLSNGSTRRSFFGVGILVGRTCWTIQRRPLEERLTDFYRDYARAILNYEWIRLFLFAGLKGVDYNARYLKALRERIFSRVIRLLRAANNLPAVDELPIVEGEYELVWSLHASIFYLGVRKWLYGQPIPTDIDEDVAARVLAFLHGAPAAMRALAAKATTQTSLSASKRAGTRVRMARSKQ